MQSNNRVSKVSRLIQKELSNVFNIDLSNQFSGIIISVTTVRITPDFSEARVFLSVFPLEKPNEFIKGIKEEKQKYSWQKMVESIIHLHQQTA